MFFILLYEKVKKVLFLQKNFLFFMYIPPWGLCLFIAIYGVVDVIYMYELNKQKTVTIAVVTAHMTLYIVM